MGKHYGPCGCLQISHCCSVRRTFAIYSEYVAGKFDREKILLKNFTERCEKLSSRILLFGIPAVIVNGEPLVLVTEIVKNSECAVDK